MADYQATIGIECHVQFKTATKLFSAVGNDAREAPANSLISHIDLGMPGALPVLNQKAVEYGIRAALALGTKPQKISKFDRKHYFYPDLPMGYQITQFYHPIIRGGEVSFVVGDQLKKVKIHEAHLEADAGKSTHPAGADYSLVDLNRAGTPLLEIVSEPEMHTAAEAKAYARELYLLMKYADVSDANLYYGNMRFDVNVSVSNDPNKLGTRSETKNINSFRAVEKVVEYEVKRQTELLQKGQPVVQETRGWDDAKQKTFSQRSKEEAHDYRYMPEPDVPPIEITEAQIAAAQASLPTMPAEWRQRLTKLDLGLSYIDSLLEAEVDEENIKYLALIEQNLSQPELAKAMINWMVNVEIPLRREAKLPVMTEADRAQLYLGTHNLIKTGALSSTNAKQLIKEILTSGQLPQDLSEYAKQQGLLQVTDQAAIQAIVKKVLNDNPQAAEDVKNGEAKAIGFLVGQVMKESKGQADPQLAQQLIKQQLN